jgi:hypothetical protein
MKFAFLDESGKADSPVSGVTGIMVDEHRVHSARREWLSMLSTLTGLAGQPIAEFHMRDAYSGREEWRHCGIAHRARAINDILDWLSSKGHPILFSATLKSAFDMKASGGCHMATALGSRWVAEAFHVALAINKSNRSMKRNKGKTVMVFDEGSGYERRLSELLVAPPGWSDAYYCRDGKEPALEQIVDTSFFADSCHAPLIQLADTVAFILRRLAEICDAGSPERFKGERQNLNGWVTKLEPSLHPSQHRYKKTGRCACADFYWDVAPPSLRTR